MASNVHKTDALRPQSREESETSSGGEDAELPVCKLLGHSRSGLLACEPLVRRSYKTAKACWCPGRNRTGVNYAVEWGFLEVLRTCTHGVTHAIFGSHLGLVRFSLYRYFSVCYQKNDGWARISNRRDSWLSVVDRPSQHLVIENTPCELNAQEYNRSRLPADLLASQCSALE